MNKSHYYDLAYAFRKSKIWKQIYEEELFAVKLPASSEAADNTDERIGYCSLMGRGGEHCALAVYIGAEGFSSYRRIASNVFAFVPNNTADLLTQDCIQCSIERKDQFSLDELNEVRAYCKLSGTPFRTPYPQFSRFYPYCFPWAVTEPDDWNAIETALTVVVKMAELLHKSNKAALGLHLIDVDLHNQAYASEQLGLFDVPTDVEDEDEVTIPLYSLVDGNLMIERIPLPPYVDCIVPAPPCVNDIAVAKIAKCKKKGVFECEIIRLPEPVGGEPPFVPALLLTVHDDGFMPPPVMGDGPVYDSTEMLNGFLENLKDFCPRTIKVRTEETRILLDEFCQKSKIRLKVEQNLELIDDAVKSLADYIHADGYEDEEEDDGDYIEEMIEMLEAMTVNQLRTLPKSLLNQILKAEALFPPDIVKKIRQARGK